MSEEPREEHLTVYKDRTELHRTSGREIFHEGPQTQEAKARYVTIRERLTSGFLTALIKELKDHPAQLQEYDATVINLAEQIVSSVTSEVGRSIVTLLVIQLCVKAICPDQSIRLHKGDSRHGGDRFSWCEGISMRSLDKNFITPALRSQDLLLMNKDGGMMTRSLAENYPYSQFYKAASKGGRDQWLELTDRIEDKTADPEQTLKIILSLLINRNQTFLKSVSSMLELCDKVISQDISINQARDLLATFVDGVEYKARMFEIAMHSFYQAIDDCNALPHNLVPLSQMRSANKKHGNVGDVELSEMPDSLIIIEAWDSKYGRPYLRDELEELNEKLLQHSEVKLAGFVANVDPTQDPDVEARRSELCDVHNVDVKILSFVEWIDLNQQRWTPDDLAVGKAWIRAFAETIGQRRRMVAPVDEPCDAWVEAFSSYLSDLLDPQKTHPS